ncbi:cation transporter, partial [Candidatus Kaiserbacteria bacterium]|nr:cation transporter [Candidatus Kaiserbacteria bacterium]
MQDEKEHAGHSDAHEHAHRPSSKHIGTAAFINTALVAVELIGGSLTNSLTTVTTALHDLGDSLILASAWIVEKVSHKKPDWRRTYGYRRLTVISAMFNALILLGGSIIILSQAFARLIHPEPVYALGTMGVAMIGILANSVGSLILKSHGGLHERVLSWHLVEDVLGWVAVLLMSVVIHFSNLYILDPIATLIFSCIVLWGVWKNGKKIIGVLIEATPSDVSLPRVIEEIERINGIQKVYDIHAWSMDGSYHVASLKVLIDVGERNHTRELEDTIKVILEKHHLKHSSIEFETSKAEAKKESEQEFLGN